MCQTYLIARVLNSWQIEDDVLPSGKLREELLCGHLNTRVEVHLLIGDSQLEED